MAGTRNNTFIQPDSFSGSSDQLLNDIGIAWIIDENGDVTFENPITLLSKPEDWLLGTNETAASTKALKYVELQPCFQSTGSNNSLIPVYTIPGRFYGFASGSGGSVVDDQHWKAYLMGGTYAEESFPGIYSEAERRTLGFDYVTPYTQEENLLVDNTSNLAKVGSSNVYHLAEMSDYEGRQTELMLPSVELCKLGSSSLDSVPDVYNFVSLDGAIEDLNDLANETKSMDAPSGSSGYGEYLVTGSKTEFSSSTSTAASLQKNLCYTNPQNWLQTNAITECQAPYYIKIEFPAALQGSESDPGSEDTDLRGIFGDSSFKADLLNMLRIAFVDSPTAGGTTFSKRTQYTDHTDVFPNSNGSANLKSLDLMEALRSYYNNSPSSTNLYFVDSEDGYTNDNNKLQISPSDSMRFIKASQTMSVISKLSGFIDTNEHTLPIADTTDGKDAFYSWLINRGEPNYSETVAFRIEKKKAGNVIQNIWMFNNVESGALTYYDSQIKYGDEYEYSIYAYTVSAGIKYRMKDLVIGKNISDLGEDGHCLQFYNPYSGENADQLFSRLDTTSSDHGALNTIESTFADNSQAVIDHPFVADFNLEYTPEVQVYEVPLFTNTTSVIDNPAPGLDVIPFQKVDNSQTIGFLTRVESFEPSSVFPSIITESDAKYQEKYFTNRSITASTPLEDDSISPTTTLEIYKTLNKPTALTDLSENLYKTITLDNTTHVFYDQVNTNKKYYYVFRLLNERGFAGPPSPVIEAEIVSDGGYKFATFEDLSEEDIAEKSPLTPSKSFKKLLQVVPALQQLTMDAPDVDFTAPAKDALDKIKVGSLDDSVFDKTFKLRLTSKKTGKKIDVNLTFNLDRGA